MTHNTDLETELESLAEIVRQQQDKIDELEGKIAADTGGGLTRRQTLASIGVVGFAGLATGGATHRLLVDHAVAQSTAEGSIGTEQRPLDEIYVEELIEVYVTELLEAEGIQLDGPFTETVAQSSGSGSQSLDVSENNVFEHTMTGMTDFSLIGTGSGLDARGITLTVVGSGDDVIWPNAFDWGDESAPEDPANGEELVVVAWTIDGSDYHAAEAWRD